MLARSVTALPTMYAAVIAACACPAPRAHHPAPAAPTAIAEEQRGAAGLVSPAALCTTSGSIERRIDGSWHVASGAMRALARGSTGDAAELAFVYRGPSREEARLASGELRRQIGLKLRARDTCNVVYVMWQLEPDARIVVSMKRNPGLSTHAGCGAGGYVSLEPRSRVSMTASIRAGERHTLRAAIADGALRVEADGRLVWEGSLLADVLALEGPTGLRTDNGEFDFDLRVDQGVTPVAVKRGCAP